MRSLFPSPSLSGSDVAFLRSYRYRGEDRGLLNRFVLGRVYDAIVAVLPPWLAPNTVTLAGPVLSLCVVQAFALASTPERTSAPWLNVVGSLAVLWFLVCDNADGKHARRISCTSPLGDWLDHSLDIVSYFGVMASVMTALGAGHALTWSMLALTVVTYELVCWEALLIGEMIIHEIEACSEGMFLCSILHLIVAAWDPRTWLRVATPWLLGFRPIDLLVLVAVLICFSSALSVAKVLVRLGKHRALPALSALLPMVVTAGSSALFWLAFPEAVSSHPWPHFVHLTTSSIFWIYVTNIVRLLGWLLGPREVLTRPFHFLAGGLPWVLAPLVGPGTALVASAWACSLVLAMWWSTTTRTFKKAIGTALFHVQRVKAA